MNQRIAANNESAIFAGVRSLGNAEVARLLDCNESTVSELGGAKYKFSFKSAAMLLARMGLKCVPAGHVCYDREEFGHIWWMAQQYMNQTNPATLEIGDRAAPGEPE